MKRPRGSIISKLLIAFSVYAVLIAVVMTVGYVAVARQNATARQLTERGYGLDQTAGRMERSFTATQLAVSGFELSGRPGLLRLVARERASFAHNAGRLRALAPPGLQRDVAGLERSGAQLFAAAGQVARLPRSSPAAEALANGTAVTARGFYRANTDLRGRLASEVRQLTSANKDSLRAALTWGGIALAVTVLLGLGISLCTLGTVTRPLSRLGCTMQRRTAGDWSARVPLAGAPEVREAAQAVNTQMDEAERVHRAEEESSRLRGMARAAGIQIREHLVTADVLREAYHALVRNLGTDRVYLHLVTDGKVGPPVGQDEDQLSPDSFLMGTPAAGIEEMRRLLRTQASRLIAAPLGPDGDVVPTGMQQHLRHAGIAFCLLTPFGVGTELLGIIAAVRLRPSRPWTAAEIDAVESIAADLGRGLNHARMYEAGNRLVAQLQELDRAKSDFFATVSHELRAPLTSIEGYVEMLGDEGAGPLNDEQRRMLGTVERSAARLRNLIEDVFTLAKLESGAFTAAAEPVNVVDVVAAALAAVGPSASAGELQLSSSLPQRALMVQGDVGQLDQVFVNLLSNAVKFTPAGGQVEVTGGQEDGWVSVRVTDSGIGIPEAEQDKLFTRFFRASNATNLSIPGTGLGLAIVRTIVTAHHGEVDLHSRAGEGTAVTVRLPLLGQDAAPADAAPADAAPGCHLPGDGAAAGAGPAADGPEQAATRR